jgi:hypothetical protein
MYPINPVASDQLSQINPNGNVINQQRLSAEVTILPSKSAYQLKNSLIQKKNWIKIKQLVNRQLNKVKR